jgi:hypothetical protein
MFVVVSACDPVSGPEAPAELADKAANATWAAAEIAKLNGERVTTGRLFTADGTSRKIGSSEAGREYQFARYVIKQVSGGERERYRTMAAASSHVETKAAAGMTLDYIKYAVLVINNKRGVCLACRNAIPVVLRKGYRLIVWAPGDISPTVLDGEGEIA